MKKLFTLALIASCSLSVSAQTNKGQFLVGGAGSFSTSEKVDDYKTSKVTVMPNVGYFIIDNLAAGLRYNLSIETGKDTYSSTTYKETETSTSLAPFVRYYFLSIGDKIKFLGDVSGGFGVNKYKETGSSTYKEKFSYWNIAAGPALFLTPNTALELTVGYGTFKYKDDSDGLGNLNVNLGFQIHLDACKKK